MRWSWLVVVAAAAVARAEVVTVLPIPNTIINENANTTNYVSNNTVTFGYDSATSTHTYLLMQFYDLTALTGRTIEEMTLTLPFTTPTAPLGVAVLVEDIGVNWTPEFATWTKSTEADTAGVHWYVGGGASYVSSIGNGANMTTVDLPVNVSANLSHYGLAVRLTDTEFPTEWTVNSFDITMSVTLADTTTATAAPTTTVAPDDDDLSDGAIAGIVVGSVAGAAVLVAIAYYYYYYYSRSRVATVMVKARYTPLKKGKVQMVDDF